MELPALVELLNTLKAAGVELYAQGDLTIKFGPSIPAATPSTETPPAGIPTGVALQAQERTRPPLPPELAAFMTAELQADLAATLED